MNNHLVRLFCDMVKIDSESGEETNFISYLKNFFEIELGATVKYDEYKNLIATIPGLNSNKSVPIMLVAHADTVKPGKSIQPIFEDGVIYSGGETILGADDKAGISEIIEAILTADKRPPVEVVITREEEVGFHGSKNLDISMVQSKMGFVVDIQALESVIIGGPTYIYLDIEIIGKSAHAGMRPEEGKSAIRVAAKAIMSIPEGRIDHETTVNTGIIRGGEVRNAVPERVTIKAECRSLDHTKAMHQAGMIKQQFEKTAAKMNVKTKIDIAIQCQSYQISENANVVKIAKDAIASVGLHPQLKVITAGTDASILTQRGIESVAIGFGGISAHSTDEHIPISNMETATDIICKLLNLLA